MAQWRIVRSVGRISDEVGTLPGWMTGEDVFPVLRRLAVSKRDVEDILAASTPSRPSGQAPNPIPVGGGSFITVGSQHGPTFTATYEE